MYMKLIVPYSKKQQKHEWHIFAGEAKEYTHLPELSEKKHNFLTSNKACMQYQGQIQLNE